MGPSKPYSWKLGHPTSSKNDESAMPRRGVYSLLVPLRDPLRLRLRGKRLYLLQPGTHVYTGSALGRGATSLPRRLARHFRPSWEKHLHWHIDFLLEVTGPPALAVYAASNRSLECVVVKALRTLGGEPLLGFGSTDCHSRCGGHLLHFTRPLQATLNSVLGAYRSLHLTPHLFQP